MALHFDSEVGRQINMKLVSKQRLEQQNAGKGSGGQLDSNLKAQQLQV